MAHVRAAVAHAETATRSGEFVSVAKSLMLARGRVAEATATACSPRVANILKAGVASAAVGNVGQGAELADYQLVANGFIQTLGNFGAFDAIMGAGAFVRLPMHCRVAVTTLGATGATVAEGSPKLITKLELANATLQEQKSICIVVVTKELLKNAAASAFVLLGDELRRGVARAVDVSVLSAIVNDTNVTSAASTGLANFATDLDAALALMQLGSTSRVYVIAPPAAVRTLALMRGTSGPVFADVTITGGKIAGVTVVPSDALTDTIIVLDAQACAADTGTIELDATEQADLQMSDAEEAAEYALTSLWQRNLHALRATRYWAFELLRPTGAAVITDVATTL